MPTFNTPAPIDLAINLQVGAIDVFPEPFSEVAMWVIFAYFVVGILMNAISRSTPERYLMAPVSLVLAVLSFLIAAGYGELAMAT